jgi:tetratricopeptide (TPR) repeat protein
VLDSTKEAERSGSWFYARGTIALRQGHLDEAIARLDEAVKLEPEVPEYRGNLGSALLEKAKAGDDAAKQRALDELELAVQWGPSLPSVHSSLSVARLVAGDAKGALAAADQAIKLDKNHVPALYNRAAALSALNRLDEAVTALDIVLKVSPGFPAAVQSRASTLKRLGRS